MPEHVNFGDLNFLLTQRDIQDPCKHLKKKALQI